MKAGVEKVDVLVSNKSKIDKQSEYRKIDWSTFGQLLKTMLPLLLCL